MCDGYKEKIEKIHECAEHFETVKIDERSGIGFNRCTGINPMILEIYYSDQDWSETLIDNWTKTIVKYCPFFGMESK